MAEKSVRVLTFNIEHGSAGVTRVAEVVQRVRPDVLCLQEADSGEGQNDPTPQLQRLLPRWHSARYGELVTLSRHPIISRRIHRLPTRVGSGILETTIDVEGQQLTFFNVHFNIPVDGLNGWMASRMKAISVVRAQQMAALQAAVSHTTSPFIILGDFNTPPRGLLYKKLASRLTDSFSVAGWGFGYTWHSSLPLNRIDYIFTGTQVRAVRCQILNEKVSDHRPVYGEITLGTPLYYSSNSSAF